MEETEEASSSIINYDTVKVESPYYTEEDTFLYNEADYTDPVYNEAEYADQVYNEADLGDQVTEDVKCKIEDDELESDEEACEDEASNLFPLEKKSIEDDETEEEQGSLESSIRTRSSLTCKLCNKKFRRAGNLRRHVVMCEGGGPYICNLCEKHVANRENLHRHIEEMHMVGLKIYVCHECGKKCTRKGNLKAHMAIHSKPKRENHFVCHKCGEEFLDRSNLMRHVRSHDGLKCEECGMKFSKEGLSMHMALHIKGKYSSRRRTGRDSVKKCLREFTEEELRRTTRKARKKRKGKKKSDSLKEMQHLNGNPLSAMWTAFNSG